MCLGKLCYATRVVPLVGVVINGNLRSNLESPRLVSGLILVISESGLCCDLVEQSVSVISVVVEYEYSTILVDEALNSSLGSSCSVIRSPSAEDCCIRRCLLICLYDVFLTGLAYVLVRIELIVHVVEVGLIIGDYAVESAVGSVYAELPGIINAAEIAAYSTSSPCIISVDVLLLGLVVLQSGSELSLCNNGKTTEVSSCVSQALVSIRDDAGILGIKNVLCTLILAYELIPLVAIIQVVVQLIVEDVFGVILRLVSLDEGSELFCGVDLQRVVSCCYHLVSYSVIINSRSAVVDNIISILKGVQELLARHRTVVVDFLSAERIVALYQSLEVSLCLNLLGSSGCVFCGSYNCNGTNSHYRCHSRSKNSSS